MSRYIDADDLLAIKFKNPIGFTAFQNIIKRQPTADVIEIVRCKDCKYYEPGGVCANSNFLSVRPNDYCSYAEKI